MAEQGCPTCGYVKIRESQDTLEFWVKRQEISACPSCGSVFLLHDCHAGEIKRTEHSHG